VPTATVISFGDELTSGQRVDTNSAWISAHLSAIGLPVVMHLTTGDDLEACAEALRFAGGLSELVVMTGGLGPTADDVTRAALALATGHELQLDKTALAHIENIFCSRGREMPIRNRSQAMFPRASQVIPNPHGTAPGIDLTTSALGRGTRFIALPGVPAEAQEMWTQTVEPRLLAGDRAPQLIRSYTLKCFGEGESAIEQRLGTLMRRDREPRLGITVHQATITLRVTAKGASEAQCQSSAVATMDQICERLGDLVFGEGTDELQDVVIRRLAAGELTLATLECDRQALLVRWLTAAASRDTTQEIFRGGIVCSDSAALNELVDIESAEEADVTSAEFCRLAAESIRRQFQVTHALVVGAIPTPPAAVANVHLGIATANETQVTEAPYSGHPDVRGPRLIKVALDRLRRYLQSPTGGER
jgi:nicotinamide-nucleotide amidase